MVAAADYMDAALFHAARGRGRTSPNPTVGALVVSEDAVVVGYGTTEPAGHRHAEIVALDMAGSRARGGTLYCTLEPCCHVGRTSPCVARIVEAGITRVVASMVDPFPLVNGEGFRYLAAHDVDIEVGLGAAAARALNQPFFTLVQAHRPFVILKAAISADGCIAEAPGLRTQLTSTPANRHAHRSRAEVDAIAVGIGTILADDPLLTARGVYRPRPLVRVIFDRELRTPPGASVLSTRDAGPVMIVTTAEAAAERERRTALEDRGAQIEVVEPTIGAAMARLGERQITSLILEGGAVIHEAAWDEDLVDFVSLYMTPVVVGSRGLRFMNGRPFLTTALVERHVEPLGPDVLIEGYVHGPR